MPTSCNKPSRPISMPPRPILHVLKRIANWATTYAKLGDAERTAEARQTYVSLRGDMGFFHINHLTAFAP